jgi:hypothetical protein
VANNNINAIYHIVREDLFCGRPPPWSR